MPVATHTGHASPPGLHHRCRSAANCQAVRRGTTSGVLDWPTVSTVTGDVIPQSAPARPSLMRKCSRTACPSHAVATLTYVYSDSTAVVGPLATYAEPHTYDLCPDHAERLTPPRGWDIVRLTIDDDNPSLSATMSLCLSDDLAALVDAVREEPAVTPTPAPRGRQVPSTPRGWESGATRGHLSAVRVVADGTDA